MNSTSKNPINRAVESGSTPQETLRLLNKIDTEKLSFQQNLELLEARANQLVSLKEYSRAKEMYDEILEQDKNYYSAYQMLTLLYLEKSLDSNIEGEEESFDEEIIEIQNELYDVAPGEVDHQTLAQSYISLGKFDLAISELNKSSDNDKRTKVEIKKRLAKLYFIQGDYDKAIDSAAKASKLSEEIHGDKRFSSELYALLREINQQLSKEQVVKEMERKYKESKRDFEKFMGEYEPKNEQGKEILKKIHKIDTTNSKELKQMILEEVLEKYKDNKNLNLRQSLDIGKLAEVATQRMEQEVYEQELGVYEGCCLKADFALIIKGFVPGFEDKMKSLIEDAK